MVDSHNEQNESEEKYQYHYYPGATERARRLYLADLKKPKEYEPKKPDIVICVILTVFFIPGLLVYLAAVWGQNKYNEYKMNKANQARAEHAKEVEEGHKKGEFDDFDSKVESNLYRDSRFSSDGTLENVPLQFDSKKDDSTVELSSIDDNAEEESSEEDKRSSKEFKRF